MRKPYSLILSLLGMLVVLVVAYKLDNWIEAIRQVALENFTGGLSWLIPGYVADLLLGSLILAWLWFIYYKVPKSRILALIYSVVGLGLLFYTAFAIASRLPLPIQLATSPKSLSAITSAIVAVVGLQNLISGRSVSRKDQSQQASD